MNPLKFDHLKKNRLPTIILEGQPAIRGTKKHHSQLGGPNFLKTSLSGDGLLILVKSSHVTMPGTLNNRFF